MLVPVGKLAPFMAHQENGRDLAIDIIITTPLGNIKYHY
jgi:hypothetical protein